MSAATASTVPDTQPPHVVVTRPQPDADRWCRQLRALGCEATALPLMEIGPVPEALQLQAHIDGVDAYDAVMWVSGHAVTRFFARYHGRWPSRTRCWAPGPGTAQALLDAGVPADLIDAPADDAVQYDAEALWPVIAPQVQAGLRILLVRGRSQALVLASSDADKATDDAGPVFTSAAALTTAGHGRDWLLQRWQAAGAQVDIMALYQRRCATWSAPVQASAQQLRTPQHVWLFSSSEAVGYLPQLMPGADWRQQPALATHDRIAQTLTAHGFASIRLCRPTPQDVAMALLPQPTDL